MGGLPSPLEVEEVDVSAEGTLVWLRRPNGTWWPSIVISPLDVPDGCPAPPRCPAVPIMLLGRRQGTTYVDWCNLDKCKRVKPFRCGELDFQHRITKAQEALSTSRLHTKGRYARIDDAILQALEIERARTTHSPSSPSPPRSPNKRKRKTPNDSPKASRRMRDLSDISSTQPDPLTSHLPALVNNQAKRGNLSSSRKKDRSRPLSELCCDAHLMELPATSTALPASTLNNSNNAPPLASTILEPDHSSQPCASPTWKHAITTAGCSKAQLSFRCEHGNFKVKKSIASVHHEGSNRNGLGHKHHHKTNQVKRKAPRDELLHSEEKPDAPGDGMHLAASPADFGSVAAIQQQHSETNRDLGDSSGAVSNGSDCANGSVSSLGFELPLQALPPLNREPDLERCRAVKPVETLQLNSTLYDVELRAPGISNNGRRVPLVSLMSKWNHKPVVGYPISVEVSDNVLHSLLSNFDDHQPATSIANGMPKKGKAGGLPSSHAYQAKPKSRKKTSGKEADKLWQPHTKEPASSSPRKMRRLSSFASSQRDGVAGKSVVGKISGPTIACIPLRVAFSRIKEALSSPAK